MRKSRLFATLAAVVIGTASMTAHADAKADAIEAAALDCLSTAEGLMQGFVERNALGPIASCVIKPVAVIAVDKLAEPDRTYALHGMRAAWDGAAANNIALLVGASNSAGAIVGIGVAWLVWRSGAEAREFAEACAVHEQMAGHRLTCTAKPLVAAAPA